MRNVWILCLIVSVLFLCWAVMGHAAAWTGFLLFLFGTAGFYFGLEQDEE